MGFILMVLIDIGICYLPFPTFVFVSFNFRLELCKDDGKDTAHKHEQFYEYRSYLNPSKDS